MAAVFFPCLARADDTYARISAVNDQLSNAIGNDALIEASAQELSQIRDRIEPELPNARWLGACAASVQAEVELMRRRFMRCIEFAQAAESTFEELGVPLDALPPLTYQAEAFRCLGDLGQCERSLKRQIACCFESDERRQLLNADQTLSSLWLSLGANAKSRVLLESRLHRVIERHRSTEELVQSRTNLGQYLWNVGELSDAARLFDHVDESEGADSQSSDRLLAAEYRLRGAIANKLGLPREALRLGCRALCLSQAVNDWLLETNSSSLVIGCLLALGKVDAARIKANLRVDRALARGDPANAASALYDRGVVYLRGQDGRRAFADFDQALTSVSCEQDPVLCGAIHGGLGAVFELWSLYGHAIDEYRTALTCTGGINQEQALEITEKLVVSLCLSGRNDEADRAMTEVCGSAPQSPEQRNWLNITKRTVAAIRGDVEEVRRCSAEISEYARVARADNVALDDGARWFLMCALLGKGDIREAAQVSASWRVEDLDSFSRVVVDYALGRQALEEGHPFEAIRCLTRSVRCMGEAFDQRGNRARPSWGEFSDPDNSEVNVDSWLAEAYLRGAAESDDPLEKKQLALNALAAFDNSKSSIVAALKASVRGNEASQPAQSKADDWIRRTTSTATSFVNSLLPDVAVVYVGVNESQVWTILIRRGNIQWHRVDATMDQIELASEVSIHNVSKSAGIVDDSGIIAVSNWFLGPYSAELKTANEIVIVPAGSLARFPWDMATVPGDGPLVAQHSLRIIPSIGASLIIPSRRSAERAEFEVAAVGVSRFPRGNAMALRGVPKDGDRLNDLPEARAEVEGIVRYIKPSTVLLDARATVAEFARVVSRSKIVHLATHSLSCVHDGLLASGVFMYESSERSGGPDQVHFLSGREILEMDMSGVDLAVLSACETSSGSASKHRGLLGLSSAFLFAGCKNVVGSLWRIDDRATRIFMEEFYAGLSRGEAPGKALRNTKNLFRTSKEFSSPFYWAAFTLWGVGDNR
ncbi:MAG: CHAT domain-containing protein [Planctomycetes bacterium]|nr:CHAT domain-containing protein [Planctomycetota bacterium]